MQKNIHKSFTAYIVKEGQPWNHSNCLVNEWWIKLLSANQYWSHIPTGRKYKDTLFLRHFNYAADIDRVVMTWASDFQFPLCLDIFSTIIFLSELGWETRSLNTKSSWIFIGFAVQIHVIIFSWNEFCGPNITYKKNVLFDLEMAIGECKL